MYASRAAGAVGSTGTYAAPAFMIPYSATTASGDLGSHSATRSPRRTPCVTSERANWFERVSSVA